MIAERHRSIAHAWVDGAEIEYLVVGAGETEDCLNTSNQWIPVEFPKFLDTCEYRVKPKPPVVRWRWVVRMKNLQTNGYVITGDSLSDEEMERMKAQPYLAFEFIQKIDATRQEFPL